MKSIRAALTVLLFLISLCSSAKEVTDTLYSAKNDRIIVTYSITHNSNKVELQFRTIRKLLGDFHRNKYKKGDEISTLFFDRTDVSKDMTFSGETPSAVVLPAMASHKKSNDGYYVVEQRPSFTFDLEPGGAKTFSIPLYLAHYEGKLHYKILCRCGVLVVQLPNASATSSETRPSTQKPSPTGSYGSEELEEEISEIDDQALNLIKSITKSLPYQDTLPMESTLEKEVDMLVGIKSKVKNGDITSKIDLTISAYNEKKKELEKEISKKTKERNDDNAFANCTTKEDYERYLKQYPNGRHVEEAKEDIKDLEAKAKAEEDSKKKKNIWMIIGGVLMAILLFVGNQVMQSIRNGRTQRSMMQMQQEAANRAKNMAQSKVRGKVQKQTYKLKSQARQKGQTMMRDAASKVKNDNNNKGNNRVSI